MKTYYSISLLLAIVYSISAKQYDRAIVAVHCFREENSDFDLINELPFYFEDQSFLRDVQIDIKKHVNERFHIDSVVFLNPGEIKTSSGYNTTHNLKTKDYALEHADSKTICLEVQTKLNIRVVNNDVPRYGFSTKIKAYNSKGKQVYKFTSAIPFESIEGDGITGPAVIGEEDFHNFYFDALAYAFEGEVKKTGLRFVQKPVSNYYNRFIEEAEEFVYLPVKNGFAYGNSIEQAKDVITFRENFWHSTVDGFQFENIFEDQNFQDGYNLTNHFNDEKYLIKLKGDVNTFFDILSLSSNVTVEFRKNKKEIVGEFELHHYDTLKGNFNGDSYTVVYNAPYRCSEFYNNDNCIALLCHLDGYDLVYVHQSATEEHLGNLFNLFFAWQYSVALQETLDNYEDDANPDEY